MKAPIVCILRLWNTNFTKLLICKIHHTYLALFKTNMQNICITVLGGVFGFPFDTALFEERTAYQIRRVDFVTIFLSIACS